MQQKKKKKKMFPPSPEKEIDRKITKFAPWPSGRTGGSLSHMSDILLVFSDYIYPASNRDSAAQEQDL